MTPRRSARLPCSCLAVALAGATPAARPIEHWLSFNLHSDHYTHRTSSQTITYNRDTLGLGVEVATTPERSWLAGCYHNSYHRPSFYAGLGYQPWQRGGFKAGGLIGGVSGYPASDVIPLVGLIASYDGPRLGVNVIVTPPVANWASGAVSMQIKVRTDALK